MLIALSELCYLLFKFSITLFFYIHIYLRVLNKITFFFFLNYLIHLHFVRSRETRVCCAGFPGKKNDILMIIIITDGKRANLEIAAQ